MSLCIDGSVAAGVTTSRECHGQHGGDGWRHMGLEDASKGHVGRHGNQACIPTLNSGRRALMISVLRPSVLLMD